MAKYAAGLAVFCGMILLLRFPESGIKGAVSGLVLCGDVVIPSLFPFMVCALFFFNCGILSLVERPLDKISRFLFGIDGRCFCIFLMSLLGGFPVGAKLIENTYAQARIDKKTGEAMLAYCVNSGPAFILIGVGVGVLGNLRLGVILLCGNLIASLLLAIIMRSQVRPGERTTRSDEERQPISDLFVTATSDASSAIIGICAFVILFSVLIGMMDGLLPSGGFKTALCSLLEVTNGVALSGQNLVLIAFLLGFSGLCVHCQILSVCKMLKPNYIKFIFCRLLHGALSALLTRFLIMLFPVSLPAISGNLPFGGMITSVSLPFSAALIFLCASFLLCLRKSENGGSIF